MTVAMLLKIFSDCCIVFAVLCAGPVSFALPPMVAAVICGAAAGVAAFLEEKGWSVLRRVCVLLPFGVLLLAGSATECALLLIPAGYTAYTILRGNLELEYSHYRHFFIRSLIFVGVVYVVAGIWNFLTQITSEQVLQLQTNAVLRYGLVHLLCGVVLQRQLRLGVGTRAEGGRRQMAMLLGTAASIAAGFLLAEPLMRKNLGQLMRLLLSLLLVPFGWIVSMIGRLISWLYTSKDSDKEIYDEFLEHWQTVMGPEGGFAQQGQHHEPTKELNLTVVWIVLAAILLIVAALLLLRSFHKRRADADPGQLTNRLTAVPKKKKVPTLSNRGKVRQMYRDFLRTEKHLGMKLHISDTSGDVLHRIHPRTDRSGAEQLRQVYLQARYDDRQNIDRAQVEQAKRALKATRGKNG